MINPDMRLYNYYTYGGQDAYAQPQLSKDVQGTVKMAICIANQTLKDSIAYKNTEYVGFTHDVINDKYVIQHGDDKLKVLFVNTFGTWKQVYMTRM